MSSPVAAIRTSHVWAPASSSAVISQASAFSQSAPGNGVRFEVAPLPLDQQDLVAVVEQLLRDGTADIARAGNSDAHLSLRHPVHLVPPGRPLSGLAPTDSSGSTLYWAPSSTLGSTLDGTNELAAAVPGFAGRWLRATGQHCRYAGGDPSGVSPACCSSCSLDVVLGEDGLGLEFDDVELARNVGTAALAVILVEGGLTTRFADIRKVLAPAARAGHRSACSSARWSRRSVRTCCFGMDWQLALLLGRHRLLDRRRSGVLGAARAAAAPAAWPVCSRPSPVSTTRPPSSSCSCSAWCRSCSSPRARHRPGVRTVRRLGDRAGRRIPRRRSPCAASRCPHRGCTRSRRSDWACVAFAAAGSAHASGFIAAYLAAVVLANSGLPHRSATRSFAEGPRLAGADRTVRPPRTAGGPERTGATTSFPAIVVGLVLLLVARPLSVMASLVGFRIPWREQVFLSWAGLRGAVPIVLATFPIVAGVPDSYRLLNIVFMLVVVFTLVQAPSLRPVAHALGLISGESTREIQVEAAPLDVLDAELLTMTVQPASRLHNVTVLELRLPDPSCDHADHQGRPHVRPAARHPDRDGRRTAHRHHQQDAGRGRKPTPCGQSAGQTGLLVRRVRRNRLTRSALGAAEAPPPSADEAGQDLCRRRFTGVAVPGARPQVHEVRFARGGGGLAQRAGEMVNRGITQRCQRLEGVDEPVA